MKAVMHLPLRFGSRTSAIIFAGWAGSCNDSRPTGQVRPARVSGSPGRKDWLGGDPDGPLVEAVIRGRVDAEQLVAGVVELADLVAVDSTLLGAVHTEGGAVGVEVGVLNARLLQGRGGRRCAEGQRAHCDRAGADGHCGCGGDAVAVGGDGVHWFLLGLVAGRVPRS